MLAALTALVIVAGGAAETLRAFVPASAALVPYFSLSYEQNLPTYYSAVLLLSCAALLAIIAAGTRRAAEPQVWHWRGLSAGFAYISLDEVVEIHEYAGSGLELSGLLYFSWVVPAAMVVTLLAIVYLPFVRRLEARTRRRFVIAGILYVTGALLMELPLGYWTEQHGSHSAGYALIDFVEESLEIVGVHLFLLALADYLAERKWTLRVT